MRKIVNAVGMASIALLLVSCQSSEDNTTEQDIEPADQQAQNEVETDDTAPDTEESNHEDMQDDPSEAAGKQSDKYEETQEVPQYFIDSHTYNAGIEFLTAFTIRRGDEQNTSAEERLVSSLFENDPSEQEILSSFTEMTVEWPQLTVNFTEDGNLLSTTSAQSSMFYDSLTGISDLYGIEEVSFLNPDGEESIIVAERNVDAPILIEDERGLTRGYYTIYNKELEQTLFLPGGVLEEPVENENGEPLTFPETIEAMKSVKSEDAFYASAIVEGFEVIKATLEDDVATVQYTMDEKIVTEADQIVFANAMQLAALDFHAMEVTLLNETLNESVMYPLTGH
ncbi:hypothetical protein [Jeotgalibacillus salarius]|uniref:GerMN domain-containing protein n=1 Tax=Jeotgalibacillus salarius TaxID=546023 RepID=A0A4Y8L9V0_9BACL|nr:hypothetical protein [Jeotgalibacillus salarius]TFD99425.1 hypothetical protein E2626_14295 [Jeotgalibacillus salarius]